MKTIKDLKKISGKKVLLRADLNVSFNNKGAIIDDFRIKKIIPTILYLQKRGAKIIILSHLGEDGSKSLSPVAVKLGKLINKFSFISSPILSNETENKINSLKNGEVVLLENLRKEEGEKKNSPSFARALSRYGDIFVNDAFSVCHREHASVVGINKHLPSYAGLQLVNEIENLSKAFKPNHPFLFILGGAKFDTKIPLIKKFVRLADHVFIGGAIANDLFKAKGYEIGESLVGSGNFETKLILKSKNIILPKDVVLSSKSGLRVALPDSVRNDETIVDVGSQTIIYLKDIIDKSKFILWNGPLGKYEDGFDSSTKDLLKIISKSKSKSIVGGGDTVAIVSKLKLEDSLSFVSTGGGATLDFLSKGTLPGIRVLK